MTLEEFNLQQEKIRLLEKQIEFLENRIFALEHMQSSRWVPVKYVPASPGIPEPHSPYWPYKVTCEING